MQPPLCFASRVFVDKQQDYNFYQAMLINFDLNLTHPSVMLVDLENTKYTLQLISRCKFVSLVTCMTMLQPPPFGNHLFLMDSFEDMHSSC